MIVSELSAARKFEQKIAKFSAARKVDIKIASFLLKIAQIVATLKNWFKTSLKQVFKRL